MQNKPEVFVSPCRQCGDRYVYEIPRHFVCAFCGEVLPSWQKTEQGYKFMFPPEQTYTAGVPNTFTKAY